MPRSIVMASEKYFRTFAKANLVTKCPFDWRSTSPRIFLGAAYALVPHGLYNNRSKNDEKDGNRCHALVP
jgi:hypothetical protein